MFEHDLPGRIQLMIPCYSEPMALHLAMRISEIVASIPTSAAEISSTARAVNTL